MVRRSMLEKIEPPPPPADPAEALAVAKEWSGKYRVEIQGIDGVWTCRVSTPNYERMDGRATREAPTLSIVSPTCDNPQEAIAAVMQILRG